MKCQYCDQSATHHVTEMVKGEAVEYHVCKAHLDMVGGPVRVPVPKELSGFVAFMAHTDLCASMRDRTARQKLAAHLLPALCLALLDENPNVKVAALFYLMRLGPDAESATAALQNALHDADERVQKAAAIALEFFKTEQAHLWFF